jgi:hypothetical protein
METMSAFQSLLLAAQLSGVDGRVALPPAVVPAPVPAAAQPAPQVVRRIPLWQVALKARLADEVRPVGLGLIGFSLGFDPQAELWAKFRQLDFASAHPVSALEKGLDEAFPVQSCRLQASGDKLSAYPTAAPQTPRADLSLDSLLERTYEAAEHVSFPPVDYAVLYEDGGLVPGSLSLLRKDDQGQFMVGYYSLADMKKDIQWFLGVDGVLYGMRIEGDGLVFYSEPVPPTLTIRPKEKPVRF